jgi:hypothetical protein
MGLVPLWIGWANRGATAAGLPPTVWIWSGVGTALVGVLVFIRPRRAI